MSKLKKTGIKSNTQTKQPTSLTPEVKFPDLSSKHLHIMIPCYAGMLYEITMRSLLDFLTVATQCNLTVSLDTMGNESLITRGRNNMMARGLHNWKTTTHFMFIDSDIRFNAIDIVNMITADKDVIGGLYPKKGLPIDFNFNIKKPTSRVENFLVEVETIATGFLMFKKEVYEKLIEAYPETKYIDDINLGKQYEPYMYAIFDTVIDEAGRYLSEDWTFCRRWQELNGDCWADLRVLLGHYGTYQFQVNSQEELLTALAAKGITINKPAEEVVAEEVIPEPTPVEATK